MLDPGDGTWTFDLSSCQGRIKPVVFMEGRYKQLISILKRSAHLVNAFFHVVKDVMTHLNVLFP